MSFIQLETARLILRDHKWSDLKQHHQLLSDQEVMYYLEDIYTSTIEESTLNLKQAIEAVKHRKRNQYFLRIECKDTHQHIGEIGYTVREETPNGKIVDLGYFIHKAYWHQGYVTEAVEALIRYAFKEDSVFRIETGCIQNNIGSEKVMQKVGMIKEGEYKLSKWHDGELKSRVSYRLLKNEWENDKFKNLVNKL